MNLVKMRKRSIFGNRYHNTISFLFVYIYIYVFCYYVYLHTCIHWTYTQKNMNMYILCLWICNRIFLFFSICMEPVCESSVNHRSFHPQENTQRLLRRRCPSGTLRHGAFNLSQWCKFAKGGCKPVWWDGFSRFFGGYGRFGDCMIWLLHPREHNIIFKITLVRVVLVRPRAEKVVVSLNPTGWGFFLAHVKSFVVESFYTLSTNSQWYEGEKL